MKSTLIIRPVPKETEDHLAGLQPLGTQGGTDGNWNTARNNTVGTQVALGNIRNMHRSTTTFAVSGLFAEEFGEHP